MIIVHIETKGSQVLVKNQTLLVKCEDQLVEHSLAYVKALHIYPHIEISSNVVRKCSDRNIDIVFCRENGHSYATLGHPRIGSRANLVSKQLKLSITDQAKTMADRWLWTKEARRVRMLKSIHDQHPLDTVLLDRYEQMVHDTPSLIPLEASLSKTYYRLYNMTLPKPLRFAKRTRMPAEDYTNALLNYGYSLLYPTVEKAIISAGLDPHIGFLHGMAKGGKAFLFDVIEMYRPWVEELIIAHQTQFVAEYSAEAQLSKSCRKYLIDAFYQMLYHKSDTGHGAKVEMLGQEVKHIAQTINKSV